MANGLEARSRFGLPTYNNKEKKLLYSTVSTVHYWTREKNIKGSPLGLLVAMGGQGAETRHTRLGIRFGNPRLQRRTQINAGGQKCSTK